MSLTPRLPWAGAAWPPLELRSGSVPAQEFSAPRFVVWGPAPKRHGGSAAPPTPPPTPPSRNQGFARRVLDQSVEANKGDARYGYASSGWGVWGERPRSPHARRG